MTDTLSTDFAAKTDQEFYQDCALLALQQTVRLEKLLITNMTLLRQLAADERGEHLAYANVQHSMPSILESLGNLLNALDAAEPTEFSDAIYDELRRRTQHPAPIHAFRLDD